MKNETTLNVTDFGAHICPGVIASIYGTNFTFARAGVSITVGGGGQHFRQLH